MSLLIILAAQAVATTVAPSGPLAPVQDPSRLSLVIADTVSETDPQPLCGDGNCASLFLGRFRNAELLAGPPLPAEFAARVKMRSPYNMSYRLAMIVEHRRGKELLVRDQAGFGDRSKEACFESSDLQGLDWRPESPRVVIRGRVICVSE